MFCKNLGEQFVCEWLQIVSTHGKTMVHNSIPTSLNEALTYNLIYWPLSYTWVYGMDTVCVCMHYPITVNIWCSITAFTILFCCCHCLSLFLSFTLSPPAPIHLSSFFPLPVPLSGLQLNLQSNWEKKIQQVELEPIWVVYVLWHMSWLCFCRINLSDTTTASRAFSLSHWAGQVKREREGENERV